MNKICDGCGSIRRVKPIPSRPCKHLFCENCIDSMIIDDIKCHKCPPKNLKITIHGDPPNADLFGIPKDAFQAKNIIKCPFLNSKPNIRDDETQF